MSRSRVLITLTVFLGLAGPLVRSRADEPPRPAAEIPPGAVSLSLKEVADDKSTPLTSAIFPASAENVIDLATALELAQAQNPTIGLSRQAIEEALAQQQRARALFLPTLRAGGNYRLHQGVLQAASGQMLHVRSSSLYLGSGSLADGTQTPLVPGVQIFVHVGDGIFEPIAARQQVIARRFQSQATANQVLLDVTSRFIELAWAEAAIQALRLSEKDFAKSEQITDAWAKVKQGRESDALRMETATLLVRAEEIQGEENLAVASAELTRVLSLDPVVRLRAVPQPDALLELVDAGRGLEDLLEQARNARPEVVAQAAEIARKQVQVRQERLRPFLPTLAVDFSDGVFGGGTNRADLVPVHPQFGRFANRTDFDVMAWWTLANLGLGNRAVQKERRAEQVQAVFEQDRIIDVVRREVASALAQVEARRSDLSIAQRRLRIAERAFQEDYKRIQGNVGLPIELLNSLDRLARARQDGLRVVADYNLAEVRLFTALGQTPSPAIAR